MYEVILIKFIKYHIGINIKYINNIITDRFIRLD